MFVFIHYYTKFVKNREFLLNWSKKFWWFYQPWSKSSDNLGIIILASFFWLSFFRTPPIFLRINCRRLKSYFSEVIICSGNQICIIIWRKKQWEYNFRELIFWRGVQAASISMRIQTFLGFTNIKKTLSINRRLLPVIWTQRFRWGMFGSKKIHGWPSNLEVLRPKIWFNAVWKYVGWSKFRCHHRVFRNVN